MTEHKRKKDSWITLFIPIIIALILSLFIKSTLIANVKVPSDSMNNTIMEGDRLIVNRLAYTNKPIERYDIVVFHPPDEMKKGNKNIYYIKRVIGLPNETIQIANGTVYKIEKDGTREKLRDDFVAETPVGDFGPYEVPANCYLMLGDNRNNSKDSRCWDNKYVDKHQVELALKEPCVL